MISGTPRLKRPEGLFRGLGNRGDRDYAESREVSPKPGSSERASVQAGHKDPLGADTGMSTGACR